MADILGSIHHELSLEADVLLGSLVQRPGPTQQPVGSSARTPGGQATKWAKTQLHPSTDRLPKVLLSLQSPEDAPFDMTQPLEGQDPAPPISGQRSVPHTRKPEQASEPTSLTRGQTP